MSCEVTPPGKPGLSDVHLPVLCWGSAIVFFEVQPFSFRRPGRHLNKNISPCEELG